MNIDEMTIGELKKVAALAAALGCAAASPAAGLPFGPGDKILIRTVTMIQLGEVVSIGPDFIVMKNGGWVADTGRFGGMLDTGEVAEFERTNVPWFLVGRGAIVDVFPWAHSIPEKTK